MRFKIERANAPAWVRPLVPLLAIVLTFIITSVFIIWAKANPFIAYYNFLIAPLSNQVSALEVLVKGTPLLLTGAAVTFAFSAGYYNIGAEGQLLAGAIAAAGLGMVLGPLPVYINIPIMLVGGFAAGMLWALIPALLKIKLAVDEVVTTLLMNTVITVLHQLAAERLLARPDLHAAAVRPDRRPVPCSPSWCRTRACTWVF